MLGKRIIITNHKAKKPYKCKLCGDNIEEGEIYFSAFCRDSAGHPFTVKACITHGWKNIIAKAKELRGY